MGGSIPTGTGSKLGDSLLAGATGGSSLLWQGAARTANDPGGAKNAASNQQTKMGELQQHQDDAAAALATQTLQQPKIISPDNFLANKANALTNLRLGLASTITGASGAPSPVLSAPALSAGGPGKTKLGS